MPTTTSFFVPVVMPDAPTDAYTVGVAVMFTVPAGGGGGGEPTPPLTGQIWPRGRGV